MPTKNRVCVRFISQCLLAWALLDASAARAEIYSFVADDGTTHFSDRPTDARHTLLRIAPDGTEPQQQQARANAPLIKGSRLFDGAVKSAADKHLVEEALLHAVIEVESGYNAVAVSKKGAQGLMQLMPGTAKQYGVTNPLDPAQNLHAGARHLRYLLDKFSGNKELALAAYNAGHGAVIAHGYKIPPYLETERYVPAVLQSYKRKRALY